MIESNAIRLMDLLAHCARTLRDACIAKTGVIYVAAPRLDRSSFRSPCPMPEGNLGGLDLSELAKCLYQGHGITTTQIADTWRACVPFLNGKKGAYGAVGRLIDECMPHVPFRTVPGQDLRVRMVQFLAIAAHHHGELDRTGNELNLRIAGGRLGLDAQGIWWLGGYRRTRHRFETRISDVLHVPLGPLLVSRPETASLYNHLVHSLPDLAAEIDVVISAAVAAGIDYERTVADVFDVETLGEGMAYERDVWDDAIELVDNATENPYHDIRLLLEPRIGFSSWHDHFFKKSPPRSFSASARAKLRAKLIAVQSTQLRKAHLVESGNEATNAVADLLSLQDSLR